MVDSVTAWSEGRGFTFFCFEILAIYFCLIVCLTLNVDIFGVIVIPNYYIVTMSYDGLFSNAKV